MKIKVLIMLGVLVMGALISGCSSKSDNKADVKEEPEITQTAEVNASEADESEPLDDAWSSEMETELEKLPDVDRARILIVQPDENIELEVSLIVTSKQDLPGNASIPVLQFKTGKEIALKIVKSVADRFEDPELYKDLQKKLSLIENHSSPAPSFGLETQAEGEYVDCKVKLILES